MMTTTTTTLLQLLRTLFRASIIALALPACAAEGGREGGGDNLPDRGITGWERSASDTTKPFVLTTEGMPLGGASAVVVAGQVLVYGHRVSAESTFELFRAEGDATGASFAAPVPLGIAGHDPSVLRVDGRYWLAYVDAANAIALATSSDGRTFTALATIGIAADRRGPSLVIEGDRMRLYLSTGTTLVHTEAVRSDAPSFGPEVEVLAPGIGCVDPSGVAEACWDEDAIVDAEVRRATTPTGGVVYRMFYAAHAGGDSDIGFAASYDGVTFERFPYNPVLTGTFDERSPTSVIAAGIYVLLWDESRSTTVGGLVRATHVPTAPSDRW